ncbi:MAG: hypothetical protein IVW55_10240 [Chloroflexi bacterium]|nr:hypothetical protein [Chloroflexota bacterium]
MRQTVFTKDDPAVAGPLPLGEAIWQLPVQYVKVLSNPSAATLSEELAKASWGIALVQVLGLLSITVTLSVLGHLIPTAALHSVARLGIGSVHPLGLLPAPWNGIAFVLASFFIGLGTAYLFSKGSGGHGTFVAHLYCLLLCTVPLVTLSGLVLLIPATGWLVVMLGGLVGALFIYRMVLHACTIMAVHRLGAGRATLIVLILPMLILVVVMLVALFFLTEGEILAGVSDFFPWGGDTRKKEERGTR